MALSLIKRPVLNILLLVASILLPLLVAELVLRVVVGRQERARELRGMLEASRVATPAPGVENVSLRGLIQPSKNDRIVYEMKPGLEATFIGVPVAINRAGFRERNVPMAKPPGTFRIAGIGDSVMFGWGVPVEATYLRVLERLLQARGDPVRYETLNFGVPGYNAVMEVETFRAVVPSYHPDLLLVGYLANDDQLPRFMKRSALRWPSNLYLYNLVFHGWSGMQDMAWELMPARYQHGQGWGHLSAVGDVPEVYRDMVGPEAVRRAYYELAAMTRGMGIPVVVMGDYRGNLDPAQVADLESHYRFAFVDMADLYMAYARQHEIELTTWDIRLGPQDPHPNALGHRILGAGTYQAMVNRGLIPPVPAAGARGRS